MRQDPNNYQQDASVWGAFAWGTFVCVKWALLSVHEHIDSWKYLISLKMFVKHQGPQKSENQNFFLAFLC